MHEEYFFTMFVARLFAKFCFLEPDYISFWNLLSSKVQVVSVIVNKISLCF